MRLSPIVRFRIPLAISSWLTFAIAFTLYCVTADPDASYWDCPEYVTVASKMEIGHPPGNPVWMIAMRVATIPFPPHLHAYVINICSGLFMAFAAFFLCRVVFIPGRIFFAKTSFRNKFNSRELDFIAGATGCGGALCFALCDSAWFSAVEAEVYAMSAFLVGVMLWIITKWWWEKSKARRLQYLILMAYLTGLSLGVHQLNLLLIPVFVLIVLLKKYPDGVPVLKLWGYIILSILFTGLLIMFFIPGLLSGAESVEIFGVNTMGLPYDSGTVIFFAGCLIFLIIGLLFLQNSRLNHFTLNFSLFLWCVTFLLLGFSSYGIILVRAKAAPPMNEGSPSNIFALSSYINRDQYSSNPLIYGHTSYSRMMFEENYINGSPDYSRYFLRKKDPVYIPFNPGALLKSKNRLLTTEDTLENQRIMENQRGYLLSDYRYDFVLTPELNMWLPRITSRNPGHLPAYADWAGMTTETMEYIPVSETFDSNGEYLPKIDHWGNRTPSKSYRPTYYQNLRYFIAYQSYYMYFRYLFWNFIGRQNDYHSTGEIDHGNFITGVKGVDNLLVGNTDAYPSELWENNKGRNRYFAIPFLFGLAGIIWLAAGRRRERRYLGCITLMFIMTGIAIVAYLNQSPGEPRERDYTFLANYMAFAMWISAGLCCCSFFMLKLPMKRAALAISALISFAPATLMAIENFDDHDRSNRFETSFFASSLLDFERPSIIFSYGDNNTFPLWYASEVLDMGNQHVPVDITYLSLPSYVENLKKQGDKKIHTIATTPQTIYGRFNITHLPQNGGKEPMDLEEALKTLYQSEAEFPEWPVSKVWIKDSEGNNVNINLRDLTKGKSFLPFQQLMLLDMMASLSKEESAKILYFPSSITRSFYQPLDTLLHPALFGKIYAPNMTRREALDLLSESLDREISKLKTKNISNHYIDPLMTDMWVRYRGELILAAELLLENGDYTAARKTLEAIDNNIPYETILPGYFQINDSIVSEGKKYAELALKLYETSGNIDYKRTADRQDSLIANRRKEWLRFYHSLNDKQRYTLSNRSKRIIAR